MALVIPSDTHAVSDTGHTADHNNIADVLGLLATIMAQQGGGPAGVVVSPPAGNAAALTALSNMASWALAGYYPWQFPVGAYGAKGDGKVVIDGAITSGQNLLTCATSAPFTAADVGKSIIVSCAGGGTYTPLATTIASFVSATQVHLTANATSTPAAGCIVGYATDDTTAIRNAIAAAVTYAQSPANQGTYAEVVFNSVVYGIAGAAVIGGATLGNAQIPLPIIPKASEKVVLVFTSATKGLDQALMHWDQLVPQSSGPVLMELRADGTNNGTFGPASMIGGPVSGYGGDLGLFTNLMPCVDGISMLFPYNSTYGGWDFFGCAEAFTPNSAQMAMAVVNSTAGVTAPPLPNITNSNNITNTWTFGVRMPCTGNNDRADVGYHSAEGLCYGLMPSEHCSVTSAREIYCVTGLETYSGNGVAMPHSLLVSYASVEGSAAGIGFFDGTVNVDVNVLDCETATPIVFDPSNKGQGTIGIRAMGGTPQFVSSAASIVNSGLNLKLIVLDNAALVGPRSTGAPAAPASTVVQTNLYYRDATIYLTASTGITVIKIDTVTTGQVAASAVTTHIRVPAGHSYSVTYTGTLTTLWVLE